MDDYAAAMAGKALEAIRGIEHFSDVDLAMAEQSIELNYRVPDESRLAWARSVVQAMQAEIPQNLQEVYANEALILDREQSTELKLQAIRIGDVTIAVLPNEVFSITGLKLRGRSPSPKHFNVELANGAVGYIPPPEQHVLGGYTTWPARTAGLEVDAEPKIVEVLVGLLEQVTGKPQRQMLDQHGPYAQAVLKLQPVQYWRLNDIDGAVARNAIPTGHAAALAPGFAWYLPGPGSGTGTGDDERLVASNFSGEQQINRAVHLAGGSLTTPAVLHQGDQTLVLWFWLGERSGASERSGGLCSLVDGTWLELAQDADHRCWLACNGRTSADRWDADRWHMAAVVTDDSAIRVYVDGQAQPSLTTEVPTDQPATELRFGERLEGKLDEIAVFDRALSPEEIARLWSTAGLGTE
jgi:hypothetical protein